MIFHMNEDLLKKAKEILTSRKNIYWIIGGSCAGKSTVCKALSDKYRLPVYNMDEYIFDKYQGRYMEELHPANKAWFTADNPLAWALSFSSWEDNNYFNIATNIEYLDLFSDDMNKLDKTQGILVDGGITNPAILAKALPVEQIFCIKVENSISNKIWSESEERKPFKEMILQLPNPDETWNKFLRINELMNGRIAKECGETGIKVYHRDESTSIEEILKAAADFFNLK